MKISAFDKTQILVEALPYVNQFRDTVFVVKYGGNAMISEELQLAVMQDLHILKSVGVHPVLVHGGGPAIQKALSVYHISSKFINGLRYTTEEAMEVIEMVLSGQINKKITGLLNHVGANAIGLSGRDNTLIRAKHKTTIVDGVKTGLGYVGEVEAVNVPFLNQMIYGGLIPVISSIGVGKNGEALNINADELAGAVAKALHAEKFVLLTDVEGVFLDPNHPETLIKRLRCDQVERLKEKNVIHGGMLPKVDCCIEAVRSGVKNAHILDGRMKHTLLLEIFSKDGMGTMIGG